MVNMQVHFLPWAGISKSFLVGSVAIIPWSAARDDISSDFREYLDRYFSRHLRNDGKAMRDIAIARISPDSIADITPADRTTIRRAVDALAFASTIPPLQTALYTDNTSVGIPNSERFQLITQSFTDTRGGISVASGGGLHAWNIDQIHFCLPWHAGSSWYRTDDQMVDALGRLLIRERGARQRERIFRAIEWFRLAHTGSDEVTDLSRIVMMATSFEVLLEPDDPFRKRGLMMDKLNHLTASSKLKQCTVKLGKNTVTVNAVAAWLGRFYDLRNSIVHGNRVPIASLRYAVRTRPWVSHLNVADLVLWEAISWELCRANLLGRKARQHANWLSRQCGQSCAELEFVREMQAGMMGINVQEYHEALGWAKREQSST